MPGSAPGRHGWLYGGWGRVYRSGRNGKCNWVHRRRHENELLGLNPTLSGRSGQHPSQQRRRHGLLQVQHKSLKRLMEETRVAAKAARTQAPQQTSTAAPSKRARRPCGTGQVSNGAARADGTGVSAAGMDGILAGSAVGLASGVLAAALIAHLLLRAPAPRQKAPRTGAQPGKVRAREPTGMGGRV